MTRLMAVLACVAAAVTGAAADAGFDELLSAVAAFEYGQDASALKSASELMVQAQDDRARLNEMAVKMAGLLGQPATTDAAKLYICRQLYLFGGPACLPHVAPLLLNAKTVDMACYAIARMPGEEAVRALVSALAQAEPAARVAIMDALGQRKDTETAEVLAASATDADPAVAKAAITGLGLLGTQSAVEALFAIRAQDPAAVEPALIDAAEKLIANNATLDFGAGIYQELLDTSKNPASKGAAVKALAANRGPVAAIEVLLRGFNDADAIVRTAAADALRELDANTLGAFAENLPGLPPATQVMVITAMAEKGVTGGTAINGLLNSPDAAVRVAAIEAQVKIGNEHDTVPMLAKIAAGPDAEAAKAARKSLSLINGPTIDDAFVKLLQSGEPAVKSEALAALVDRNARQLIAEVFKAAAGPDDAVRSDAFKAIAKLGGAEDVPALIDLLVKETSESARAQVEAAVVAVARKAGDTSGASATALAAFPGTKDNVPARAALVHVVGKLGDDSALEALRGDLGSRDAQLQEASVRALSEWPTAAPSDDLLKVAETGASETIKKLALRGYLRLVGLSADLPATERVAMYEKGMPFASEPGEKVALISGLAECPSEAALALIRRYENDPEVAAEVKLALDRIKSPKLFLNASDNPGEAGNATDGDPATRWTTGKNQEPRQWFSVDLGWPAEVVGVRLDATGSDSDFPKAYEVYVSNNPDDWGEPVAKGKGDGPVTEIGCTPKAGRYVCIFQTGQKDGLWWSIHELKVDKKMMNDE